MAAPSICMTAAGPPNRSGNSSTEVTAMFGRTVISPVSSPVWCEIGSGSRAVHRERSSKAKSWRRGLEKAVASFRQRAVGWSQRQPKVVRYRRMGYPPAAYVEPVAQMRVFGERAPPAVIGERQDEGQ